MKINSLRISNVLSFKYYPNIDDAPEIKFDSGLNILIGQNGSGKSTALEVINFIFKKILFHPFAWNQEMYSRRANILAAERRSILINSRTSRYGEFRLDPNWNFETSPQEIKIEITLDEIDKKNLEILDKNKTKLNTLAGLYSDIHDFEFQAQHLVYTITIKLDKETKEFTFTVVPGDDAGFLYLKNYNFYKELINIHNLENPGDIIESLFEPFVLIGGYRNYNAFSPGVSLQGSFASQQMQGFKTAEYSKSANALEQNEPTVFALVRLQLAGIHFELFGRETEFKAEQMANELPFLKKINEKLKLVNLKVMIRLVNKRTWEYSFSFEDTKRNKAITDINSLSGGQKSITHLIFEAYGRGELKGGLIIIDEPEIHLHHQFQNEYLRIIEELNKEQNCQYVLVTHSESLINSETIAKVKRFALDRDLYTWIAIPTITADQKTLVKILDNTRSTYALFAKKVVLVEGDSDRYFFKAALVYLKPQTNQEIAVLDMGGKDNYEKWKNFFESFGLQVYFIGDFDNVFSLKFAGTPLIPQADRILLESTLRQSKLDNLTGQQQTELKKFYDDVIKYPGFLTKPKLGSWTLLLSKFRTLQNVTQQEIAVETKSLYPAIETDIDQKYSDNIYMLKKGSLEDYTGIKHGDLNQIATFCDQNLSNWLSQGSIESQEIENIINRIAQ